MTTTPSPLPLPEPHVRKVSAVGVETYWNEPIGVLNRVVDVSYRYNLKPLILLVKILFHVQLPTGVMRLQTIRMPHPFGIFISGGTKMGRNCTVFQGVTLGSKRFGNRVGAPQFGDEVIIYPNAVVVGAISIGARAVIGAGAIVVDDVPERGVVGGNPARLIGYLDVGVNNAK